MTLRWVYNYTVYFLFPKNKKNKNCILLQLTPKKKKKKKKPTEDFNQLCKIEITEVLIMLN